MEYRIKNKNSSGERGFFIHNSRLTLELESLKGTTNAIIYSLFNYLIAVSEKIQ
jgi:hypothetical protein